jgi:tetratricopeptide (TPR) repeat protein
VAYQKYLEAPNWPEEGWEARLFLARCHAAREDWQEARHTFEQAVLQCPERAEGLVGLAYTLLELDEPRTAATWFRMAANLPEPDGCRLFVEVPIYRWGAWHGLALALDRLGDRSGAIEAERRALAGGAGSWAQQNIDLWVGGATEWEPWRPLFDLGVHSFYAGEMKAGRNACEHLLALADVPDEVRLRTRRNQIFYAPRLSELAPSAIIQEIVFETQEGWSRFNPSIAASDDGYLMIVRSSNYTVDKWMRYTMNDGDEIIRTTNYLVTLDDNLSMQRLEVIEDRTDRQGTFYFPVSGFEDCRLFRHHGSWYATATTREHDPGGLCRVALLRLDGSAFSALQLLDGPAPGRHEKNWMPMITSDGLRFMYSCRPTIVLRCDEATGEIEEVARKPGALIAEHFRGGSQAVEVQGRYLFVVHESVDFEDGGRVCPHRFIFMDQAFSITHISPQFFFLDRALEFCTGLALRGELLTASFGYGDREAHVASVHLGEILAMLQPVSGGWCPFPAASSVPPISVVDKPAPPAEERDYRSMSSAGVPRQN